MYIYMSGVMVSSFWYALDEIVWSWGLEGEGGVTDAMHEVGVLWMLLV